ncbi:MAG TPA: hypothetical protein VII61_05995, partial [Ktedonobacteraceae bacterium]
LLYKEEQEKIAAFKKRCEMYRQKLEEPDATFTYQEKREALEYFGVKVLVWRVYHKPRYSIASEEDVSLGSR